MRGSVGAAALLLAVLPGCDGKGGGAGPPAPPPAPLLAEIPPPSEEVLRLQREIALPAGFLRDASGRIRCAKDDAEVVLVPAGEFTMGSAESVLSNEKPAHRVTVSAFLVDRTEVTVGRYRAFCRETGREFPIQRPESTERHPVTWVTFGDAEAYAAWAGRRLPTEAEWEKAARGTDGRAYPWGREDDGKRRNGLGKEDGFEASAPVGSFPAGASPCGALDMAGNVWEWCADWYAEDGYASPAALLSDPAGPPAGTQRVLRGGGCSNRPFLLRCAVRNRNEPAGRFAADGFRCARSLP